MGTTYLRGTIWWVRYHVNGKAFSESSGSKRKGDAKNLLNQREGDKAKGLPVNPKINRITFEEMAKLVKRDYTVNGKKTLYDLEIRLDKHLLPFLGHLPAGRIGTDLVEQYKDHRLKEKASNGTINRELTALKRAFRLAAESGKVSQQPVIKQLQEDNVRIGFFEREQFINLQKHLADHLKPRAEFAFITGWRQSEIGNLQWRNVDFTAGEVRLDPGTTKNGDGRVFPFTRELRTLLENQQAVVEAYQRKKKKLVPWVFPYRGKRCADPKRAFNDACTKASMPGRIFHDFRRTAVRNLVRAGIPERVAMQMTGHKTRAVFERYNIVSEGDLKLAAEKLDAVSQGGM